MKVKQNNSNLTHLNKKNKKIRKIKIKSYYHWDSKPRGHECENAIQWKYSGHNDDVCTQHNEVCT